jgi:hypothetical protein
MKDSYIKLSFLDTVDLVVGTSDTIPIDLYSRVYRNEKDLEIVRIATGLVTKDSDWETLEEEEDEPKEPKGVEAS